ncbi:MAG TPA: acetyl-CoA carboxylase biotin carboxyl carrier protein [Caulobacteraceae bacterium]|nr:acetyl-CoA carboxylase biotin carboxyl carrier protein [Caulobacteraceae bacterium]
MAEAKGAAPQDAQATIDPKLVRRLAGILIDTGLTEIEVQHGELRIRVARELTIAAPAGYLSAPVMAGAAAPAAIPAAPAASEPAVERGDVVKSPMVGTIYLQPQPDSAPFVRIGDTVRAGDTLLIVEAMKTMNPIPAPRDGKVIQILVDDAQPVEFGEPLVVIE